MNEDKLNKSFLTTEAKEDINEMLGRGGESGGSSFTSQVETTEGLTLGKGTDNEESLTAEELSNLKIISGNLVHVGNYIGTFPMPIPVGVNLLAANNFNDEYFWTLKPNTYYTVIGFLRVNEPNKKVFCIPTNYFFTFQTDATGKTNWLGTLTNPAIVYNFEDSEQTNIKADFHIAIYEGRA